jgi:hypothetical protein
MDRHEYLRRAAEALRSAPDTPAAPPGARAVALRMLELLPERIDAAPAHPEEEGEDPPPMTQFIYPH